MRVHAMKNVGRWLVLALVGMAGCGRTAFKIEPVPAERTLEQTTLIDEGGLFPDKIVVIDVSGMIVNSERRSLFGGGDNPVSVFVEHLDKASRDPSVKGVVLRINSPGGGVTASDIMYTELLHFKKCTKGKVPVVAMMMDVAASGGYYLACGADEIVALPTSITGSIGVIMLAPDFSGTLNKIGAKVNAIKSGKMKDVGSPFKSMDLEERAFFQKLINEYYDRFVKVVAAGRPKLDEAKIRELADGRVYTGEQALENGIVDRVGTLRDALAVVKERIGAKTVRVVVYKRPGEDRPNIYAQSPGGVPQLNLLNIQIPESLVSVEPQFMYLWAPGF
jgi:protease-4